ATGGPMSTQPEEPRHEAEQAEHRRTLEVAVRDGVIRFLGRPAGLRTVQVRQVYGDKYRVNVFVGSEEPGSIRVAHSYFVAADSSGKIIGSTPAITRQY